MSGSNNFGDRGQKRFGDVIYEPAVVEVKRKKSVSVRDAKKTRDQARQAKKPWVHVEFSTGQPDIVKITVNHKTAQMILRCLNSYWLETAIAKQLEAEAIELLGIIADVAPSVGVSNVEPDNNTANELQAPKNQ